MPRRDLELVEESSLHDGAVGGDKMPLNAHDAARNAYITMPRPRQTKRHFIACGAAAAMSIIFLLFGCTATSSPPYGDEPGRVPHHTSAREQHWAAAANSAIPTYPAAGGGGIPALIMGGDDFRAWFEFAGPGAGLQTFYSYRNGAHIGRQVQRFGRANVFISTGIPCGCCGADSPRVEPMDATLAMAYIDEELAELNTSYVDLLLFHHRCRTFAETASVWRAFEDAKAMGKARHIGVSNFNTRELRRLSAVAVHPPEVLEAHFGAGVMDFEVLAYAREHHIHINAFSSLSMKNTDHPTLNAVVEGVANSRGLAPAQVLMAYVANYGLTVLTSCFRMAKCPGYYAQDLAVFDVRLSADEMAALDNLTLGKRTCTDCFTDECQMCARALHRLGCPIGQNGLGETFPVWGRSNPKGTVCQACAALPEHAAEVYEACGSTEHGETIVTMVPKACGI